MKTLLLRTQDKDFSFMFSILAAMFASLAVQEKTIIWILFSTTFLFFIVNKPKYIGLTICLFFVLIFFISYRANASNEPFKINGNFKIIRMNHSGIIINKNGLNILIPTKLKYNINDIVHVDGVVKPDEKFLGIKINSILNSKIEIVKSSNDYRNSLKDFLNDSSNIYRKYSSLMLLGQKNKLNSEIYNLAVRVNVVHLFVISGFHITLLYIIIFYLFKFSKANAKVSAFLPLVVVLFYLYTLRFPISATRAFLLVFFATINKELLNKRFSNIEILSFVMFIMLLYNPYSIKSFSFILTFIATFVIFIFNEIKFKRKITKWISFLLVIYLSTLPIIISLNNFWAPMGFLYSSVFAPLFIVMYSLTMFLFPIKPLMGFLYEGFDWLLHFADGLNPIIQLPSVSAKVIESIYLFFLISTIIFLWQNFYTAKKII